MDSKFFKCCYYTTNIFQSLFLLAIRLYWGFLFFIGGYFKISNMAPFIDFFQQLGLSSSWAYVVAVTELVCGVLLFLGLLSRLSALVTAGIMLAAYISAHPLQLASFFTDPAYFFSAPPFSFMFASLVVLFFGPGVVSLDGFIKKKLIDDCCSRSKHKR